MARKQSNTALEKLLEREKRGREAAKDATIRSLRREVADMERAYGKALEFNDDLAAAITAYLPPKPAKITEPDKANTPATAVLALGDWHTGEKTDPTETDAFGAYNWQIQQARVDALAARVVNWVGTSRHGWSVKSLHTLWLGDLIQGELHEEYRFTNEFTIPEQVWNAAWLGAQFMSRMAGHFERVEMDLIGGDNHARLSVKPQSKCAARNSYNYLVFKAMQALLERHQNVTCRLHLPLKAEVRIGGHPKPILIEHGHTTKAWMGIPFYGIERAEGREARKRLHIAKPRPYLMRIGGHWHVPARGPFGMINGALCGSNEYDAAAGRYAPASQTSFLLHPRHGAFNYVDWNLEDAK